MRIDLRDGDAGAVVEHIEGVSGAFMLHNVLSPEECDQVRRPLLCPETNRDNGPLDCNLDKKQSRKSHFQLPFRS